MNKNHSDLYIMGVNSIKKLNTLIIIIITTNLSDMFCSMSLSSLILDYNMAINFLISLHTQKKISHNISLFFLNKFLLLILEIINNETC